MNFNHIIFIVLTSMLGIANSLRDFRLHRIRLTKRNLGENENVVEEWFEQKLDHFNPQNTGKFRQRFFYNPKEFTHFNENSPIFLSLAGEAEAEPSYLWREQIAENYAPHFGAGMILLEHRYYGKSRPTQNYSIENMRYLSSQQALQDAAVFVEHFNRKFNLRRTNKWIVFGESYAGNLAAWMRLEYPHLLSGAVASGALVKAVFDNEVYLETLAEPIGEGCSKSIQQAVEQFDEALEIPTGIDKITEIFNLCERLNISNELEINIVMYYVSNRFTNSIDSNCRSMKNMQKSVLERFAEATSSTDCLDANYENFIAWQKKAMIYDLDEWAWFYQTCTEFGYFQSSGSSKQLFRHFSADFFSRAICTDVYDKKFNKEFIERSIEETNSFYGGTDIQVTNVVFVNGDRDPWHRLGVINQKKAMTSNNVKVILIPGGSHCADMASADPSDSPALTRARESIVASIELFLN